MSITMMHGDAKPTQPWTAADPTVDFQSSTAAIENASLRDNVAKERRLSGGGQPLSRTVSRHVGDELVKTKRRASLSDKLVGNVEVLAGRVVGNQDMIERGQMRKGL